MNNSRNYTTKQYTFIDLFSGAGGLTLGFEQAGFKNIFSVDNEKSFNLTYKKNFPNHKLLEKNIEDIDNKEIIKVLKNKRVDVVVGGPPCQGFSIAGNIGRKFIDDPRNHLFKEFVRVVEIVQPKFFVMENVSRLYSHNKGKTRHEIHRHFENIGYKVSSEVMNTVDYGVPQKRNRVIFIGTRTDNIIRFPASSNIRKSVEEAIGDLPKVESGEKSHIANHSAMNHTEQMLEKMKYVKVGGSRKDIPYKIRPKSGDARKYVRYDGKEPSFCITGDMRKVFHYKYNRALTVRELARLQSFPDNFIFMGTTISQQQQVGNAVPPKFAYFIAKSLISMLEKEEQALSTDHINKYPKINFIGNKEKIANWICANIPEGVESVFDAFSGGGSVSFSAKKLGYTVFSNDVMKVNYLLTKALVENSSKKLSSFDVEFIFSGKPIKGFVYKNYSNKLFFSDECMQLDQYRQNIMMIKNPHKKALALSLLRRSIIRKLPYSKSNVSWDKILQLRDEEYSYLKYKRRRAYHNLSFKQHFLNNLDEYNSAVFDNGKNNKCYNYDVLDTIKKVEADLIYLDPPYTGTMNDYFGFYGFFDNFFDNKIHRPFVNNFVSKNTALDLFEKLFSSIGKYRYWMLSYNNSSYPDKESLVKIMKKYTKTISVIEMPHIYKTTGKKNKQKNIEYLFIAESL